jgi:hypothetical protein
MSYAGRKDEGVSALRETKKSRTLAPAGINPKVAIYSTTEGRQNFPGILQDSFGYKAITGFGRYGRALGALVPMEAVQMLAGDAVDNDIRARIQETARSLIVEMKKKPAREAPDNRQKRGQAKARRAV